LLRQTQARRQVEVDEDAQGAGGELVAGRRQQQGADSGIAEQLPCGARRDGAAESIDVGVAANLVKVVGQIEAGAPEVGSESVEALEAYIGGGPDAKAEAHVVLFWGRRADG